MFHLVLNTIWWSILNNPEFCIGSCGGLEDLTPEVDPAIFFATGGIIGDDGMGQFSASLNEGDFPTNPAQVAFPFDLQSNGLVDSFEALIILAVRFHGEIIPGLEEEQTTTHQGGCSINNCQDIQVALFEPVSASAVSVPEPSTLNFLITAFGAGWLLKRKTQPSKLLFRQKRAKAKPNR